MEESLGEPNLGSPRPPENDRPLSFIGFAYRIWNWKWILLVAALVSAGVSFGFSLFLPPRYVTTATIMAAGKSSSSNLSQLSALAASFGVSAGGGAEQVPTLKILAILNSRTLAEHVVDESGLGAVLSPDSSDARKKNRAVRYFQKNVLSVTQDDSTGLITVTIEFEDAQLCKTISDSVLKTLDRILQEQDSSATQKSLGETEHSIVLQATKVNEIQQKMASFQRKTKIFSPQGVTESVASMYNGLVTQKLNLQLQLSRMETTFTNDNSQIQSLRSQMTAIDEQINKVLQGSGIGGLSLENVPEQLVEFQNLARDLEIATKLYAALLGTYENQSLATAQNKVFVELIDPPLLPDVPSGPLRQIIIFMGTAAGLSLVLLYLLFQEKFRGLRRRWVEISESSKANSGGVPRSGHL